MNLEHERLTALISSLQTGFNAQVCVDSLNILYQTQLNHRCITTTTVSEIESKNRRPIVESRELQRFLDMQTTLRDL